MMTELLNQLTALPPEAEARGLFPPAEERKAWGSLSADHRAQIAALAEKYAALPYPMRTASGFLAFVRNGSRRADEDPYFLRRRKLCAAALSCCAEDTPLPDDVTDGIWCICEESSWVISAHNVNPIPGAPSAAEYPLPDPGDPYVDLFSAQTGMILSLVLRLLGTRLDAVTPMLRERAEREIEARILTPFQTRDDFWWMGVKRKDLNNWTPWILSNVLICACLSPMDASRLTEILRRAAVMLDRWLDTVPADGGCDEGAGYWNMAGGALLDCLELTEAATGTVLPVWKDEKLRNILAFPRRMEIGDGWFINFADCDARPFLSGERLQYAGERTGDPALTAMGKRFRGRLSAELDDVPHFFRLLKLLFHPAPENAAEEHGHDVWLPDLQVRAVRRGSLTLCCKGGHNGENHNHNDVGSFMLYADGEPEIVDAGNAVYTAASFSSERYSLWHIRSAWHNVPLIGGEEQKAGREYAAREVRCLPDGMSLEAGGAYGPETGLRSFRRTFRLTERTLTVEDCLHLERETEVSWCFLLRKQPEARGNVLYFGNLCLKKPEGCAVEITERPVTDPRMAKSFPGSLWRLRLTPPASALQEAVFEFQRRERTDESDSE